MSERVALSPAERLAHEDAEKLLAELRFQHRLARRAETEMIRYTMAADLARDHAIVMLPLGLRR